MENLNKQQLLTIRQIVHRYMSHNISLRSSRYRELEEILDALTDALVVAN